LKFTYEVPCSCGGTYFYSVYGDAEFGPARCSKCGLSAPLIDCLSVSVTAERLLRRSKAELDGGDYSLSIVIGVMAVESYLTRLFLKLKGMEHYAAKFEFPDSMQEAEWEKEFPRGGGFPGPADFVSRRLLRMTFDEFVGSSAEACAMFSRLPESSGANPIRYFQDQLFRRRNRIVHWGYVNSGATDGQRCYEATLTLISILREMDKATDWVAFATKIAEAARKGVATEKKHLQEMLAESRTTQPVQSSSSPR
jgi:hypothetical protein